MPDVGAIWPSFKSLDRYVLSEDRGTVFLVELYKDFGKFDELLGECLIDGKLYRVIGVERFMHMPPWHAGEQIGLLAKDVS